MRESHPVNEALGQVRRRKGHVEDSMSSWRIVSKFQLLSLHWERLDAGLGNLRADLHEC